MSEQLYNLYELLLILKAKVHGQSIYHDPILFQKEHWIDVRIEQDDPPLYLPAEGIKIPPRLQRNFTIKLKPNA